MAPTGRKTDFLGDTITLTERVRKLEVMRHMRTLVPRFWSPTRQEADAIAGHVMLIGLFSNRRYSAATTFDTHVGPAAQYLWAKLEQEGFSDAFGVKAEWTNFLMFLGALPGPQLYDPISCTTSQPFTPELSHVAGFTANSPIGDRVFAVTGVPPATDWTHFNAGIPAGGFFTPNHNGAGFYRVDGTQIIPEGGFHGGYPVNPIITTDATYGFTDPQPCGNPGPVYNGRLYPGIPLVYAAGPLPCPAEPPGGVFNGGNHYRVDLWLPTFVQLEVPPKPRYGAWGDPTSALRTNDDVGSSSWGNGFPGFLQMIEYIEEYLPDFPNVAAFYEKHMTAALAQQRLPHHLNHLSLRLSTGMFGRVEAYLRDQLMTLRGTVAFSSDNMQQVGFICGWGVFDDDAWDEDLHGYVLPETALTPGANPRIFATLNTGEQVPCTVATQVNGFRYITIEQSWAAAYHDANDVVGHWEDYTLTFDGATIAMDW